ncbi:MAG: hypothetical protein HPY53_08895 [Brevinematales bacterium]|nr:hypothetical protein [Brevinematales bacterium]
MLRNILFFGMIGLFILMVQFFKITDVRGVSWGMNPYEIKKAEKAQFIPYFVQNFDYFSSTNYFDGKERIAFMDNLYGYDILVTYAFESNQLTSLVYQITNVYHHDEVLDHFRIVKEKLQKDYGEPDSVIGNEIMHWKTLNLEVTLLYVDTFNRSTIMIKFAPPSDETLAEKYQKAALEYPTNQAKLFIDTPSDMGAL